MYVSACLHGSNDIPKAIPMFWGSGNMARVLRMLSDVWISGESIKIAETYHVMPTSGYRLQSLIPTYPHVR